MSQILNEVKLDYKFTTREGVHVTITGVPTRLRHAENGEEIQIHGFAVALRLEQLVRALVTQDPTTGKQAQTEFA